RHRLDGGRARLGDARLRRRAGAASAREGTQRSGVADALRGRDDGWRRGRHPRAARGDDVRAFAELYAALDSTTKTTAKVQAMARPFVAAEPADAAWAIFFLSGRKIRQVVPSRKLASWAIEAAGISSWLFEESYHAVGDLAETIALLLPSPERT